MKAHWVFGFAMLAGFSAHAGECEVMVYVSSGPVPFGVVGRAEAMATAMFREVGVQIRWRRGGLHASAAEDACVAPLGVVLDADATQAQVSPDAYAYATPFADFGTCIHVFLNRIAEGRDREFEVILLAHVLAHEITHVLERTCRHSADGVMKAHWDLPDYERMKSHSLYFATEDVASIHLGIARRAQHAVAE